MKCVFIPGDSVKIVAINAIGRVDAVTISLSKEVEYRVCYWINGERYSTWMYEAEIEAVAKAEK